MPDFIVNGDAAVTLPPRPLSVQMTVNRNTQAVMLEVVGPDSAPRPQQVRPDFVIVPRVAGAVDIRVRPVAGHTVFPNGTSVNITIAGESDFGGDRALINGRDVSGCATVTLSRVEVGNGGYLVTAVGAPVQRQMNDLAARARTVAREILTRRHLAQRQSIKLAIVVDSSISMRDLVRNQAVRAGVDVLAGIADAVATEATIDLRIAGAAGLVSVPAAIDALGTATQASLTNAPFGVGFTVPASPDGPLICITDAPCPVPTGTSAPLSLVIAPKGFYEGTFPGAVLAPHPVDTWGALIDDTFATAELVETLIGHLLDTAVGRSE